MDYFPIFLKLDGQPCLLVGGGEVALRKASLLRSAGARLTVVAPALCDELAARASAGELIWHARTFDPKDVDGMRLVVAATDDTTVNRAVFDAAEARGILVNVVDQPVLCRYITPAIVDRSPLVVAISTGGGVPVMARHVRTLLESVIPHRFGDLARLAGEFRSAVKARFADVGTRRLFWEKVLTGSVAEQTYAGKLEAARQTLTEALDHADPTELNRGAVYLVGGGPGNPDLLTFRALRLMQLADVVLYDNLVPTAILDLVRRDAERLYVGKQRDRHALPQEEINQLLVRLAQEGRKVVRLKGGDPFIFGRGGEEIETLAEHGIDFEVVPGITSASGASCFAGIPLTHRDHAQSVTFVTGHRRAGETELDWPRLVSPTETVVVYMGVGEAPTICRQLIEHGRDPATPAAVVEKATTEWQRVVTATLATLPDQMQQVKIESPALIIIGSVVGLHEKLRWYGRR